MSMVVRFFVKVFVCLLFVLRSCGFNVYTKPDVYSKPTPNGRAFFGYTVTLHSYGSQKSMLVGAPVDNVTYQFGAIQHKFGAVYRCLYKTQNTPSDCQYIPIDDSPERTSDEMLDNRIQEVKLEEKSGQWLGGTLHSSGRDGKVVVCAPRYIWRGIPPRADLNLHYRWMLGRCFTLRSDLTKSAVIIDPCGDRIKGNNYYGYCQAGFSAQFTKDKEAIVMGAVGITRWKGGVIVAQQHSSFDTEFSTKDQTSNGDYMGYSVTYGHFSSINKTEYVGGAPRGDRNMGKVLIYDYNENENLQVTSPLPQPKNLKIGSYFGSVVCAVDLNNDKYTDILVGAPQYSDARDEGRVFVYINNRKGAVDHVESMVLIGDNVKGAQFGSAIASVGDLNKDGFQDVAIGSPYDGPDGGGAVFIYHGNQDGIENTYRQRILASEISKQLSQPAKMFGCSIAGGLDVDGNKYDDIAVGAYGSENAFLFRTRRIINLDSRLTLSSDQIVLENNKSVCKDTTDSVLRKCINITVEFMFEDKDASSPKDLNISYDVTLDLEQGDISDQFRRMYFISGGKKLFSLSRTCLLQKQREWGCTFSQTVYLRDKNRIVDKLSSLTFLTKFKIIQDSCELCPILNDYKPKQLKKEATFLKECAGKVCQPNLELESNFKVKGGYREVRVGTVDELTLEINVTNLAFDAAYRSRVFIKYPIDLGYIGPRLEDQGVQCSNEAPSNGTGTVICEVGNPLKGKDERKFGIRYSTLNVKGDRGAIFISVVAESANKDTDERNNKRELKVAVKFEADLAITGTTDRKEIVYSGAAKNQDLLPQNQKEIGPQVVQTLTVTNNGPSIVDNFNVEVRIPFLLTKHEYSAILYLLQIELLGSAGSCNGKVNSYNIPVENNVTEIGRESKRKRRDTESSVPFLNCNKAEACKAFICRFGRLLPGKRVDIKLTSRLWINTFILENLGALDVQTNGRIILENSTNNIVQSSLKNDEVKITLRVKPQSDSSKIKTPIWIFVVSALGGAILLALAVVLMYRAGFFKRRIAKISGPTQEETQPMNPK